MSPKNRRRFANLRAQRDAEIELAKSLPDEIERRLAAYLGDKKQRRRTGAILSPRLAPGWKRIEEKTANAVDIFARKA